MWDVKILSKLFQVVLLEFYLNYVGCKVLESEELISSTVCFTLTMWDVKKRVSTDERRTKVVLP